MNTLAFHLHTGSLHASSPMEEPQISAMDRGFQLGDGVFTTLVCFDGTPFLLDRHIARLIRHAELIGLTMRKGTIEDAVESVIEALDGQSAIVRITLTRGEAARGLWPADYVPSLLVTAQPWFESLIGHEASLIDAAIARNQHSPLARIKSLAYLENILAARQAAEAGADDALIRNLAGNAVSTTIANVFAVEGEALVTPPLEDGCLDGVMRALVLEEAASAGLACKEESLTPDRIERCDGLFLTNSVRIIRPVTALAGRPLPCPPPVSKLFRRLLARIERETSFRFAHADLSAR